MSQKIYLDDCADANILIRLLEAAGHQVVTPRQTGIVGKDDEVHLRYATDNGLILLTKNPADFGELHKKDPTHNGILLVYQDNDSGRDMGHAHIVQAIANMEAAGVVFAGACLVVNAWRY